MDYALIITFAIVIIINIVGAAVIVFVLVIVTTIRKGRQYSFREIDQGYSCHQLLTGQYRVYQ